MDSRLRRGTPLRTPLRSTPRLTLKGSGEGRMKSKEWIPACAGMTQTHRSRVLVCLPREGGGPRAVTGLDSRLRRGTPLVLQRNTREEHPSPWTKGLGGMTDQLSLLCIDDVLRGDIDVKARGA